MKKNGKSAVSKTVVSTESVEADCHEAGDNSPAMADCGAGSSSNEELIREKAFALYEARRGASGSALEDWLMAESMVSRDAGGGAATI
jgi:hypothetical protein